MNAEGRSPSSIVYIETLIGKVFSIDVRKALAPKFAYSVGSEVVGKIKRYIWALSAEAQVIELKEVIANYDTIVALISTPYNGDF
eukprot:Awhi_evm1s1503